MPDADADVDAAEGVLGCPLMLLSFCMLIRRSEYRNDFFGHTGSAVAAVVS